MPFRYVADRVSIEIEIGRWNTIPLRVPRPFPQSALFLVDGQRERRAIKVKYVFFPFFPFPLLTFKLDTPMCFR